MNDWRGMRRMSRVARILSATALGMALWALASGGGHVAYAAASLSVSVADLSRIILMAREVRQVFQVLKDESWASWAIRACADQLVMKEAPQGLESAAAATYFSDVQGEELKELKIGLFSFSDTKLAEAEAFFKELLVTGDPDAVATKAAAEKLEGKVIRSRSAPRRKGSSWCSKRAKSSRTSSVVS